jgi:hypothetical protein
LDDNENLSVKRDGDIEFNSTKSVNQNEWNKMINKITKAVEDEFGLEYRVVLKGAKGFRLTNQ